MNEQVKAYICRYPDDITALFLHLRQLILGSSDCVEEKLWARLPSYYTGEAFVRLIPFKDHINIEASAILRHAGELSGFMLTPKGMLQVRVKDTLPTELLRTIFAETLNRPSNRRTVMEIRLVVPTAAYEAQAKAFRQEFFDHGEMVINGSEQLDRIDNYGQWLTSVTRNAAPSTVDPNWVLTDTFFAVDEADRIVGIIDLRRELKGWLTDFGHTGYSVRPTERRKGYATQMLRLLAAHAKAIGMTELQLSVERSNTPSARMIVRSGGVLQRSFAYQGEPADVYVVRL